MLSSIIFPCLLASAIISFGDINHQRKVYPNGTIRFLVNLFAMMSISTIAFYLVRLLFCT